MDQRLVGPELNKLRVERFSNSLLHRCFTADVEGPVVGQCEAHTGAA